MQTFRQLYPSVFEAKVICDSVSRVSKGFGFIKFGDKSESERALQEMNGKMIKGKQIKMNYASQRNKTAGSTNQGHQQSQPPLDPRFQKQGPMGMMQPLAGGPMYGQMGQVPFQGMAPMG
mmetsp:Transcript_5435/g.9164  ORF Transcript_5435/g.9164 Transcript_5435/m.9164 type:complete len:120 (-) Transcript_5435:1294-1653(-)